jgi:hypothetical protein
LPGVAAAAIAAMAPDVPSRFTTALGRTIPITPIGPVDRVLAPLLVVAELLSWGAAFTSLGLLLATWTPRIGRAIGISLAVFLVLSIGWMFLCRAVIMPALRAWVYARYSVNSDALIWIDSGLMSLSPMAAPIATVQALDIAYGARWQFWAMMAAWCLLAWAAAGVMYWRVLATFDRRLGRMRETSQGTPAHEPPRLVPVGAGCQNDLR